ncbi:MAG: DUF4087 domain-containing protein [Richelia sp. CSU_2_1]|nr:DUF4087 domain-containing protein [Richelia sp. CSU_2_1]
MKINLLAIPTILSSLLSISAFPASATEIRCGWLHNPTPANWYLTDKDGQWTIGVQGGYQASGIDNIPQMNEKEYVKTNVGSYGYGCACLEVTVDRKKQRITLINGGEQLPLKTCREDPKLPKN